jgi:NDP-sugar pyrophosphorylase family protein
MIAMVLAAGFGTRLRPLTTEKSKVALSLAGVPVVVRVVRMLRDSGIERVVVNLHHAPDSVRSVLEDWDLQVEYSPENEILGTGGALWGARELIAGQRVMLVNGDCYYGAPDFRAAVRFHEERGSLATMVLIGMPEGGNYRGVEIDGLGRLVRVAGRPEGNTPGEHSLHFPGIHILEPEFVAGVGSGFSDINSEHYPSLIGAGAPVFGWRAQFAWHDLGTPERFHAAASELIAAGGKESAAVIQGEECRVDSSAKFSGPVELGADCRIGAGCRIEASMLGDGVVLGDGARIRRSLLGDGVELGSGTKLDGVVAAIAGGRLVSADWC